MAQQMVLEKFRKKIRQQSRENDRLSETVQQLESAVKERQAVTAIREADAKSDAKTPSDRMKALVTRRKLVDLARLQAEEIAFLRNQVVRVSVHLRLAFRVAQWPAFMMIAGGSAQADLCLVCCASNRSQSWYVVLASDIDR